MAAALLDVAIEATVSAAETKHGAEVSSKLAKDIDDKVNSASSSATGRAISAVIAGAWAEAYDGVCTEGGAVAVFEESLAEQLSTAYAELWAFVAIALCEESGQGRVPGFFLCKVCAMPWHFLIGIYCDLLCHYVADTAELKEWQASMSDSTSIVEGDLKRDSQSTVSGRGSTANDQPDPCDGNVAKRCCGSILKTCNCGSARNR